MLDCINFSTAMILWHYKYSTNYYLYTHHGNKKYNIIMYSVRHQKHTVHIFCVSVSALLCICVHVWAGRNVYVLAFRQTLSCQFI